MSSGVFWQKFSTLETSSDGHCLVYSIIESLNKQHDLTYEYRHVLNEIRHEIDSNMSYYTQLPGINSVFELHRLLCAYIDGKNYDTPLGDCLPMILSNALHFNVVIIHRSAQSTDPIIIFPIISSNRFVYIYKCGDHYEGIEANICFDPVVGIQNLTSSTI